LHRFIVIRRLDLWSVFKVAFFIYAAIGLVVGIFYALFVVIASSFSVLMEEELPFGFLGGFVSLVAIPVCALLYGMAGSVFITIGGLVYNLIANFTGGVRFNAIVEEEPAPPAPARAAPEAPAPTTAPSPPSVDDGPDDLKAPHIDLS